MLTLPSSGFRLWSCGLSLIRRTAGCGPACPVVWQGRRGDPSPYADWRPRCFAYLYFADLYFPYRGLHAGGEIHTCKDFKTFKERGEWVELCFMVQVIEHGFKVSKPWGDSSAYDVAVESGSGVLKVQVKSTDCRTEFGYLCQFK